MNPDIIQVTAAVYDPAGTYARHAGVLACSIFANTERPVCFNLLHDDTLTQENREKFERMAHGFGKSVRFFDVSEHMDNLRLDADELTKKFTRGTLFRLLIPDLIESDKIIYLDVDVIVNMDIGELWDIPISGMALAGALDDTSFNKEEKVAESMSPHKILGRAAGFIPGQYINAGVLLMNLEKMRAHGSMAELARGYFTNHKSGLPDQDFLNFEYLHEILVVDNKFNFSPKDVLPEDLPGRIWHFMGSGGKPWNNYTGSCGDILYWQYLDKTPWRDELIESMMKMAANNRYFHRHSKDCINRLKKQIREDIVRANPLPFVKSAFSLAKRSISS